MAETLWNKGKAATEVVEEFTVCNDRTLDLRLAKYDVTGSMAHIRMLESIGLLSSDELEVLTEGLRKILSEIEAGSFVLEDGVEDIHSQVELLLTRRLGDIGKKIHSGRSRNDQVLVDVKLFLKDEILTVRKEVLDLFEVLQSLSEHLRRSFCDTLVTVDAHSIAGKYGSVLAPFRPYRRHPAAHRRLVHDIVMDKGKAVEYLESRCRLQNRIVECILIERIGGKTQARTQPLASD